MTHVVAFQRHRSRLRAVQFQVAQGTVALQPRATPAPTGRTLPSMMSLGRSHHGTALDYLEARREGNPKWLHLLRLRSQQALRPRVHTHLLPPLCQRAPRLPPRTGGQFLMLEEAIRPKIEMMGGQSSKEIAMISRKITLRALLQHLRRLSQERIPPSQEQTCLPRTMLGSLRWIDFFCKVLCQTRVPCLQAFRPIKAFAQLYSRGCVVFGDPPLLLSAFFNSMQRPKGNSPTGSGRNSFGVPASPPLSVLQDCAPRLTLVL